MIDVLGNTMINRSIDALDTIMIEIVETTVVDVVETLKNQRWQLCAAPVCSQSDASLVRWTIPKYSPKPSPLARV